MKLKFHAKTGHVVPVPGRRPVSGQFRAYVGRELKAEKDKPSKLIATEEPHEVDTDKTDPTVILQYRLALVRDGGLWPADVETAQYFGVEFVPLKFVNEAPRDPFWEPASVAVPATEPTTTGTEPTKVNTKKGGAA